MSNNGTAVSHNALVPSESIVNYNQETARFILMGDVNTDGDITVSDVSEMLKYLAEWDVDISVSSADKTTSLISDSINDSLLFIFNDLGKA